MQSIAPVTPLGNGDPRGYIFTAWVGACLCRAASASGKRSSHFSSYDADSVASDDGPGPGAYDVAGSISSGPAYTFRSRSKRGLTMVHPEAAKLPGGRFTYDYAMGYYHLYMKSHV